MGGGIGQWLQSLGAGILRAGRSVSDAFSSIFSAAQGILGRPPDAGQLRGALEGEQLAQVGERQPDQLQIRDWLQGRLVEPPDAVFNPISHDIIRQSVGELSQPYQIRQHMVKLDENGEIIKDKWVTLWFDHNPTPGELAGAIESYWATAGELYGYDLAPYEFEAWEDRAHPDWRM